MALVETLYADNFNDDDTSALINLKNLEMTNNIQSSPERSTESPKEPEVLSNGNVSDDEVAVTKNKKRVTKFSDSDSSSDLEKDAKVEGNTRSSKSEQSDSKSEQSDSEDDLNIFKSRRYRPTEKSRIRNISSDSESHSGPITSKKNKEQQIRMKNKRIIIKEKFNGLLKSRGKKVCLDKVVDSDSDSCASDASDKLSDDLSSVDNIKKIIEERTNNLKSTIYDPDTSDEEGQMNIKFNKKKQKSTKLTSPKPMRMSAKQAMENMQKIKSESNRMLREKEVSLPYHRPKALSLKDIMSRRKPAVSSDGKSLPIKMNDEQLRQYAKMLEERQKEMIELCKSESDDEQPDNEQNLENTATNIDAQDNETEETINLDKETGQKTQKGNNTEDQETKQIDDSTPNEDEIQELVTENVDPIEISTGDVSAEMSLVYNDSVEEQKEANDTDIKTNGTEKDASETVAEVPVEINTDLNTETNSQNISLHLSEQQLPSTEVMDPIINVNVAKKINSSENTECIEDTDKIDDFSDDDINMEDIDALIENTEIIEGSKDHVDSPMLIRDSLPYKEKPKLTGAPGMVIDLDGSDATAKKLSGVELLKERFTYFSKLKTPEEMERDKEKRIKPGTLHLKLKYELEQKIAEQRSLEWAKRLEEEKQHHKELSALRGDESDEDEIDKIEAKLEEKEKDETLSESDEEEEEEELVEDKPRKRNPMIADEAEESDCDEDKGDEKEEQADKEHNHSSESETSDESSSDEEAIEKPKKGRILKAFEDSDDEEVIQSEVKDVIENKSAVAEDLQKSQLIVDSQDDELQLAQLQKSYSEDLFTSQDSSVIASNGQNKDSNEINTDIEIPTQSFSILNSDDKDEKEEISTQSFAIASKIPVKLSVITETQPFDDNLDAIVGMCSGSFSQNLAPSLVEQPPSPSQDIGDDILAMCTGKFYDNKFVSQDGNANSQDENTWRQDPTEDVIEKDESQNKIDEIPKDDTQNNCTSNDKTLKSILDELDGPEFNAPKTNKYFCGGDSNQENQNTVNVKKRFVLDSDDEEKETAVESGKKKKLKKRKPEKRALQISDDEEEPEDLIEQDMEEEIVSELEEDDERLVEYDSEENEVIVTVDKPKKKRKTTEFFEQEAELTSEDEWVGSGDEDERGLDRMEREDGDDDHFHQGELQRELGQIHMRDVLDQDKREVRIIQELLFEDGDLGDGHRQRKFRWKDDGNEVMGTVPDLTDTQEEEFESEELWRKQRHERDMFLKQMQKGDDTEDNLNVSINRNTIIKANLSSRTMSSLLLEANKKAEDEIKESLPVLKKPSKDIPSPKKPLAMFQQNYHGSILNRGSSALARLAAIATPLAGDEDTKIGSLGPTNKRNFVFATLTQEDTEPKVTKRKAEANTGTPRLLKKMKTEEKQPILRNSLLDHMSKT